MEDDPDWSRRFDQPYDTPSTRRTAGSAGLPRVFLWALGPVSLAIGILVAVNLPTAINAALGHGTQGSFTAVQYVRFNKGGGEWTGTFKPANNGPVVTDVTFNGSSALYQGSVVRALYDGAQAFDAHGSTVWVVYLVALLVCIGVFVSWCIWVLFQLTRQRGT
jgi:hypothetical protein